MEKYLVGLVVLVLVGATAFWTVNYYAAKDKSPNDSEQTQNTPMPTSPDGADATNAENEKRADESKELRLAIEAYYDDYSNYPNTLADLVPDHIATEASTYITYTLGEASQSYKLCVDLLTASGMASSDCYTSPEYTE